MEYGGIYRKKHYLSQPQGPESGHQDTGAGRCPEYVDGLVFRNNRMERTDTWAPISPERPVLLLRHNRNVTIGGNTYDGKEKFTQTIQ